MRRFSVSVLIVLSLVSRVSTQDNEPSTEISRILYNQTSHLPKVLEVIPNGEVPAEEVPASKERELGQSQPSRSDTSSGGKPRRIRESSEPPHMKDRTRLFLLISPLLVTLLGGIFCAVVLWKRTRGVRKIVHPTPNADYVSIEVEPGHGGSCGITQEEENEEIQRKNEEESRPSPPEGPVRVSSVSEERSPSPPEGPVRVSSVSEERSPSPPEGPVRVSSVSEERSPSPPEGPVRVSSVSEESMRIRRSSKTSSRRYSHTETNGEEYEEERRLPEGEDTISSEDQRYTSPERRSYERRKSSEDVTVNGSRSALWKPTQDVQTIVRPAPNAEYVSIEVEPGHGGSCEIPQERENEEIEEIQRKNEEERSPSLSEGPVRVSSVSEESRPSLSECPVRVSSVSEERSPSPLECPVRVSSVSEERSPSPSEGPVRVSSVSEERSPSPPEGPVRVSSVSEERSPSPMVGPVRVSSVSEESMRIRSSETNGEEFEDERRLPEGEDTISSEDQRYTSPEGEDTISSEDQRYTSPEGEDTISSEDQRYTSPEGEDTISSEDQRYTSPERRSNDRTKSSEAVTVNGSRSVNESTTVTEDDLSPEESSQRTLLQKLMALDISARNTLQKNVEIEDTCWVSDDDEEEYGKSDMMSPELCNPLDVVCGLLHRSDMISQQQIVYKMSMCQFAVPLLLPSPDRQDFTFMLWSMRDIVKRWRPHCSIESKEYKEDSIVNVPMPVFSFLRLGPCTISKSRYLNQVISPSQQNHNFFVHGDMPGGNIPRKHSDGLVEICWYLPAGQEQLDVFHDPIAVVNLRGDLESNREQFWFLTRISSGMFIFIEDINENQRNLLSSLQKIENVFFILNVRDGEDNSDNLKTLMEVLPRQNTLVKNKRVNDSQVVKKIRSAMKGTFPKTKERFNLKQIAEKAAKLNIRVDENFPECQETKAKAKEITDEIKDVNHYKKETMKLQGEFWKQMSRIEKEICRMRDLGDRDVEEYKSELQAKLVQLQELQGRQSLTPGMARFQEDLRMYSLLKRKLFLKWLKILLDTKGRHHLRKLQDEYKLKCKRLSTTEHDLERIDQKIVDGSLGVEHFIRELGQFYEIHLKSKDKFIDLPRIAADLLLDGFPLELIDGDASNIPLQWITDVLTELDEKTGGQCRMRVITVLGVQSTGKSTLLNTMFGLQFPVASGPCTRGAFMTLINAKNFQEELNCDFILVIDTEGLKSLDLASLENSYEHDNELATVVVGLSDITIVNMAMENAEEMKDILQIVVHAFLRMKGIGKKSSCQFIHQNVSDVSAHVKNRNARQKFLEQLSEMAKVAARMEKRSDVNNFSDIISCDIERDSWYIPGLWYGIPPMASVNTGYSEMVSDLKQSILRSLQSMAGKPQNIREFTEWIKSLWNAVKHEKFVFSFRNSLVSEAYNQLCVQYADWEWTFQKNVHRWMMETETFIYNLPYEKINPDLWNKFRNRINQLLDKEETAMEQCLEEYFESDLGNSHLLKMFRGDFVRSVKYLRKQLENVLHDKCEKTIRIQKDKSRIQAMQAQYIDIMEEKIAEMMERRKHLEYLENNDALKGEFEAMWEKTLSTLSLSKLETRRVGLEILPRLKRDMDCDEGVIMKWFDNLNKYKDRRFDLKNKHFSSCSPEDGHHLYELTTSLIDECKKYVEEVTCNKVDFNALYAEELLSFINKKLRRQNFQDLHITKLFEIDLKLHILGSSALKFQEMHEDFVQRNDPRTCLETLKPQYYSVFKNMYEKRDDCRRKAEQFCELCLQPAITDHIYKYLGKEMMDGILQINGSEEFKSRKRLQLGILKKLLKDKSWDQYVEYVNDYESFLKRWISTYIAEHYKGRIHHLQAKTLHSIMAKVQQTLDKPSLFSSGNLHEFLVKFCDILNKDLVISKSDMKVVSFQSINLNVKQFAEDVKSHLGHVQDEIQRQMNSMSIESILSQLTMKPQEELFKKMIGCGKQCPFCKAPCEAGGADHKEHFTSLHRPRGLGQYTNEQTNALDHSICSTNVISNKSFSNEDTDWKPHPYKDYRTHYPDWAIYPDMASNASDYWKFVLKEYNSSFAKHYRTSPGKIPEDWYKITHHEALTSLRTTLQ